MASAEREFAVYVKLIARAGEREHLATALVAAARAAAEHGAIAWSVNTVEGEPDALWVAQVWPDRATHDAIAHGPAMAEASRLVRDLLAEPAVFSYGRLVSLELGRRLSH